MFEVAQRFDPVTPVASLRPHPRNPNVGDDATVQESVERNGFFGGILVQESSGYVLGGHTRLRVAAKAGAETVPALWLDVDDETAIRILLVDNRSARKGHDDERALSDLLASLEGDLAGTGYDDAALAALLRQLEDQALPPRPSLKDQFLVPPFSVLDARQGYWQERKRQWLSIGIRSELGRGEAASPGGSPRPSTSLGENGKTVRGDGVGKRLTYVQGDRNDEELDEVSKKILATGSGTSVFDPVLCELVYRWFCPAAGAVLDPFAGGSVRGVVASLLGHPYVGVDLSESQISANLIQAGEMCSEVIPRWFVGDSRNITSGWPAAGEEFDLVFSCPPYYDLEVYTDDPADLSRAPNRCAFVDGLAVALMGAISRLRDNRFVVLVMGEARGKTGDLHALIPGAIEAAERAGLRYYNEAVLVTMVGSLCLRAGRQFASSRKMGRTHQTVLVFTKGDGRKTAEACGTVEVDGGLEVLEDWSSTSS